MPERTSRAARGRLRAPVLAMLATVGFAHAAEDHAAKTMPPALGQLVQRLQAESEFRDCVDAFVRQHRLGDAMLVERIAARGLASDLYASIAGEIDDPEGLLRDDGFVPAHQDAQVVLAEKSLVLVKHASGQAARDAGGLPSLRPLNLWMVGVNEAVEAHCAVPAHLQPGGDALRAQAEAIVPYMEEGERVSDCLAAAYTARGIDEDAAYALIEAKGFGPEFRSRVLALAGDEQRAELAKATTPAELGRGLLLMSAATFDLGAMAKARGVSVIYLDRALDGACAPNEDLKAFIGVANRANH